MILNEQVLTGKEWLWEHCPHLFFCLLLSQFQGLAPSLVSLEAPLSPSSLSSFLLSSTWSWRTQVLLERIGSNGLCDVIDGSIYLLFTSQEASHVGESLLLAVDTAWHCWRVCGHISSIHVHHLRQLHSSLLHWLKCWRNIWRPLNIISKCQFFRDIHLQLHPCFCHFVLER